MLCSVEFGAAAFFFEVSSQSQHFTGLQPYSTDFIVKKIFKSSQANVSLILESVKFELCALDCFTYCLHLRFW